MTCNAMIERMLEADADELLGHGATPLAVHLRECARCRAVASQLVAETRSLTVALGHARPPIPAPPGRVRPGMGPVRWGPAAGGILVAAVAVFIVVWPARRAALSSGSAPPHAVAAPTTAANSGAGPRPNSRAPSSIPPRLSSFAGGSPILADRYAPPEPIAPVPITSASVGPEPTPHGHRLAVRPPPNVRAAVLQTADPTITVVLIY